MESKVILLAYIDILPGFEGEVKEATIKLAEETRKEPGSELFLPHTQNDSPRSIAFYEIYQNDTAFQLHKTLPHATSFFEFVKGKIVDDKIEVVFLTPLKSSI
ncbi:MAG: antibiotic biosynthesis monooxygenase [Bacteroidetes bacterium]|jgi:quinol monooxygenase YgiN|nr:antibiotic biosynthesis monooxygenase [Bacteroidota bacterium]